MSELKYFNLPDVGEGLTEAEIVSWHVRPGDEVAINQTVVEIETAKASVELPCPYDGVVGSLLVAEGQTVEVGTPIVTIDDGGGAPVTGEAGAQTPATGDASSGDGSVLVGYGPRARAPRRRPRKGRATGAGTPAASGSTAAGGSEERGGPAAAARGSPSVLAKPPVRKLARDLGVDLRSISPSGPGGTITRADVTSAAGDVGGAGPPESAATGGHDASREQRIPVKGVRKSTAAAMVSSAFTAPHVTEFLSVDVTETVDTVERIQRMPEFADIRVSPLLLVAKALLLAVRRHPMVNASWDEQAQEIVVKEYVNLGIAVASSRGLVVPNIKGAEAMPLAELGQRLQDLTRTARDGTMMPADAQGGTITITNVGVFGVDSGTAILNPGEAAILAVGAIGEQPWVYGGEVVPRQVVQLSMSFDHRVVDGELGARFLADIGAMLNDPTAMLAWG